MSSPPRPIRVLAVDHTAGVESFRRKFSALAAHPEIELTVLGPDRWIENYRSVRLPARSGDAGGYRLRTGSVIWPGYENRSFYVSGLLPAMSRADPEILHLWEEPFSLMALQALVARRWVAPHAKALFFSSDNLSRDFRYPYRPSIAYATIERWVHGQCEAGTAVTEEVRDVLRAKGFTRPIDVVPHGLDLETYPAPTPESRVTARARLGARGVVIGYAGRLLAMKGVDVLLRAVQAAFTQTPGVDASVVIVGDGPEKNRLRALAETPGLSGRVLFLPAVRHEEMPALLGGFDVTVMPSISTPALTEQFGRVAVEGMASGSAVVVSSSGGLPSVVGQAGVVSPEGDAAALAGVLARLMGSPAERAALGERGRARVREHFTWSVIAASLVSRYQALLGRDPSLAP